MPKIVRFHKLGAADVLQLDDLEPQQPGPAEVRINVMAIGLNRAEVLYRQGNYLEAPELPARIGYEAAGYVDAVGAGVTEFKVGDFVSTIPAFHMSDHGVYGEQAVVPARALAKMPSEMKPTEAAAVWMQYLTAYGALVELSKIPKGGHVVITAASSSVGFAAIQMVKDLGGISIATTRTSKKKHALFHAGADHVIATEEEPVHVRINAITKGSGADVVFDAVAGNFLIELARATKFEGDIFIYGALSLESTPFPLKLALKNGLNIHGYTMMQITRDDTRLERAKKYILERLKSGAYKPVIDKVFDFSKIAEAHKYMESNQQAGKIVVVVE